MSTTATGKLSGLQVVITAAGQGIGRASALMLAREGATVLATDISEEALQDLGKVAEQENLKLSVRRLDVTCKEHIENLAQSLEKVDVLFNCAGCDIITIIIILINISALVMFTKAASSSVAMKHFR